MPTPPCPIPPPLPPAGARAPAPSHAAAGHSYSASLPPTYRLSAFPVSPSATNDDQGSFSTLAPGLGLEQRSSDSDADADDDDTGHRRPPSPPSPSTPLSPSSHRPTRTTRGFDCPSTAPASAPAAAAASSGIDLRSTSASSARSSSSCTDTSASTSTTTTEDDVDECATPLSSLAGSTASMTASESCRATAAPGHAPTTSSSAAAPRPPLTSGGSGSDLAARLEWGMQGLVVAPQVPKDDAAKREREARAVRGGWEDPALAAARRALWDDVVAVDEDEDAQPGEVGRVRGEEGTAERRPGQDDGEAGVSVRRDDNDDDVARDGDEEEDRGDDDEGLPRPRRPCHTTLAPRFSCLRHSPSARASLSLPSSSCPSSSDDGPLPPSTSTSTSPLPTSGRLSPSAASTSSTSEGAPASVTFSCAPPETCPTWSAEAYSRRGDAPVEKLSIREWIELQGVREAVGVWSGKIAKWDEAQVLAEASAGAGGDGQLSTPTRGRPPGGLAAVVGVVHISRSTPTSPVDPNRMPFP
ncbi:uncharacterized protein RHOBADRAFT_50805 [Rhodotorula graminis WP1]|uniref:Proteophosphoglycan ppg4 n=1 Tax=Rhodotorula graminis (strain WP1) TaxID=578459 RepID=A0A194SD03_RHOGW|nr:uncharacterized protein RHOBADRAFT_50805 [Rhodotorula graminis WP1]KPV78325.1 hypothetical protein RHOBADRAFT_50805 [Rhodotorula graminis WP1]